jgi:arabinan endo-1,5-alpha-L-arabinosidase
LIRALVAAWALTHLLGCAGEHPRHGCGGPLQPLTHESDGGDRRSAPRPPVQAAQVAAVSPFERVYDPSAGETSEWYINDHTFIRGADGVWHLFGITHAEPAAPLDERMFAHATAPALKGPWRKQPPALTAVDGESVLWAPHVIAHGGGYFMFYCAGGAPERYQIRLATSPDLWTWTRRAALFEDGYDARDPFVIRVGEDWVMYYTATSYPEGGNHLVAYRTSSDLLRWSDRRVAFVDPSAGTFGGPTESPFVVDEGAGYYLFIGPRRGYVGTDVFFSEDPFRFDLGGHVGHIASHAAEVVEDVDGQRYASSAGWGQGGVWLAPIRWSPVSEAASRF